MQIVVLCMLLYGWNLLVCCSLILTDIPTTSGTDTATSPGTDTAAIVGGVVAVVALLIIAGVVVMIVILVMRQRNHESSLSVGTHAE